MDKRQLRIWAKKGLLIESGRIKSTDLAETLGAAFEHGFEWFPLDYYVRISRGELRETKLKFKRDSELDKEA